MKKFLLPAVLAAALAAGFLHAQATLPSRPVSGAPHRPPPPVVAVLDLDHDGMLSPAEIAAAPTSLLALDRDGDGFLSPEELCPPPPQGDDDRRDNPPPHG